jgi:hypothetical protein
MVNPLEQLIEQGHSLGWIADQVQYTPDHLRRVLTGEREIHDRLWKRLRRLLPRELREYKGSAPAIRTDGSFRPIIQCGQALNRCQRCGIVLVHDAMIGHPADDNDAVICWMCRKEGWTEAAVSDVA